MEQFTVAASVMIDLARQLEADGIPSADLCARARVDPAFLERPHDRILAEEAQRIWGAAVALTGDPLLGMHLTERFRDGALNILGYVLLNCEDVRAVLECLCRYVALLNDGLTARMEPTPDGVAVLLQPVPGSGNPLHADGRQVFETMATGMVLTLRRLTGRPVIPLAVSFRHAAAGPLAEYHRVFGTLVRFGAARDSVTLRLEDLNVPIHSADVTLLPVLEGHARSRLEELERGGVTSRRVLRAIAVRLTGRAPGIGIIAPALAMSARALQRALQGEGTTFQGVLDEARRRVAERELRVPGATAAEVALLLGYSETSPFTRAFRRWTGMTPSAWAALDDESARARARRS